jgi:hypothetical protein
MVARADVLVENFAPGVMDRLGVGAAALHEVNPRLVYGSSSGYGKDGPYRDYPAMDLVMQAMCGVIDSTGHPDQPPVKAGAALCDFMAGIHLYAAIMTALYEREHTGTGRVIEVSMQDATYASLAAYGGPSPAFVPPFGFNAAAGAAPARGTRARPPTPTRTHPHATQGKRAPRFSANVRRTCPSGWRWRCW